MGCAQRTFAVDRRRSLGVGSSRPWRAASRSRPVIHGSGRLPATGPSTEDATNAGLIATELEMAKADPELARALILARGLEVFADGLIDALKPGIPCGLCHARRYQTWAYRVFAKIAKLVDATPQVLAVVLSRFGVSSEPELQSLIEQGRRLEAMAEDPQTRLDRYRDASLELLEMVLRERPEWRGQVIARLGAASHAVEVSGNGDQR